MSIPNRYFIINKPFNMVSQFVSSHDNVNLLGQLNFDFPEGTHAIGRLDNHSEGLLILTTDKRVTKLLFQGETKHKRTYLVQVKNLVSEERLQALRNGISISANGGGQYITEPCDAEIIANPKLFNRGDIVYDERIPNTWLRITLTEGKFHQIRKMVAAIHHRCKRLVRVSIEDLLLEDLQPGEVKEIEGKEFFKRLKIDVEV